jgi:molybdopterin-guanine dinucleotide biosynthesis protein A
MDAERQALEPLSLVIQAGGNSSRMGTPKSLLPFLGMPLLERLYRNLSPIAAEVLVVCNAEAQLPDLPVRVVPDTISGLGALGGLFTAMTEAQYELVAVVACDLPFANAGILAAAADLLRQTGLDAAVPKSASEYFDPLHAVYRRDVCRAAIQKAIQEQKRRLISWFPDVQVLELDMEFCREYDPRGLAFFNINTPEDFTRAEALAKEN